MGDGSRKSRGRYGKRMKEGGFVSEGERVREGMEL